MATITMSSTSTASGASARFVPAHTQGVSHMLPLLFAIALLAGSAVLSVLISGPMH